MTVKLRSRKAILLLSIVSLITAVWAWWYSASQQLKSLARVAHETGLQLPTRTLILDAKMHLFSLVDGDNYDWLIQSEDSLLPWARLNMNAQQGGWLAVNTLADLSIFDGNVASTAKFSGAWRSVLASRRNTFETSYLYLSLDGKVGILSTFRP